MNKSSNANGSAPKKKRKVTLHTLNQKRAKGEKAVFLTSYDFPSATFAEQAGVDMILVGDSGGMCLLGHRTTMTVTMEEMLVLSRAVCRAAKTSFVVGDMPFLSYQVSDEEAVRNAGAFIQSGCDAVKCEGGRRIVNRIKAMVDAGVSVMGHLGLTPQNASQLGGYRIQGRTLEAYQEILEDALALQEAGVFSILLEAIPNEVAGKIRDQLDIPVYGIGAGVKLDGQLVIMHDIVGAFVGEISPKFVKRYANVGDVVREAFRQYSEDVREERFPAEEHFYPIEDSELQRILAEPTIQEKRAHGVASGRSAEVGSRPSELTPPAH